MSANISNNQENTINGKLDIEIKSTMYISLIKNNFFLIYFKKI